MPSTVLDADTVGRALAVRDLTDPGQGPHALQQLLSAIQSALGDAWGGPVRVWRAQPVVSVADNYDRLLYPADGAARDARYTRYVSPSHLLRTQTSAMVPAALRALASPALADLLLVCPGLVYRRDAIDRWHTGEPHQVDLWRVRRGTRLGPSDLRQMAGLVLGAALPGRRWRSTAARHPYTLDGLQLDVESNGGWVEVGEAGLAHPVILDEAGWDPRSCSGLAMGLGLDRLLMLRKGIADIRLLRCADSRVAAQMQDLAPYRPVSSHPPIRRDLSLAVSEDEDLEDLGDRVRDALVSDAHLVEAIERVAETPLEALPPEARARLGISPGQKNVLVRLVLRALDRTLTHGEANVLRDRVYAALHQGRAGQWAARPPGGTGSAL